MNERTKTGFAILQIALILGVLGDVLLRVTPWGLNAMLFNVAFVAGVVVLIWRRAPELLTHSTMALLGALLVFASMFAWRDSIELRVADTSAILVILSVVFVPRLDIAPRVAGVIHYIVGFVWSSLNAAFAPGVLLAADIEWKKPRDGWQKHAFSAMRGVAIAAPLVLIFGALFMAADAVYAGWVQRVFNINAEIDFTHVVLFLIFSWMSAGYLRGLLIRPLPVTQDVMSPIPAAEPEGSRVERVREESGEHPVTLGDRTVVEHLNISDAPNPTEQPKDAKPSEPKKWNWANIENSMLPQGFTLGTIEVGVILGLVNLLFLSFIIVQVPYLFGGMDLVQNTPDFKLAEYARRGFGELVAVAGLVLPILLISHWLVKRENPFTEKLFRVLAGVQIALLFVIMASAVQRLVLLTGNLGYGMTTVRLYPLIFMAWLAVVFIWFGATVLRGARQLFAWGALWSAFVILGATHVLNPDEFIVKTNIALMRDGRQFDAHYNSHLSDDALPALWKAIPEMNALDRERVTLELARRFCQKVEETDPRSWNLSRQTAAQLFEGNTFVQQLGGCESKLIRHAAFAGHASD